MSETKVRLSVILPGSVMLSSQECDKNPTENYDHHRMMLEIKSRKSGRTERQLIEFNTRKCKPAVQSINISREGYDHMTAQDGIPEVPSLSRKYNKITWMKMTKKERLLVHLTLIAENLGGKVEGYEIFED